MTKIYVIHENNDWTKHLQNRLEELKLPFELWHLDQGLTDLSKPPPNGVFYNRISASSHTRDHRYAPEYTEAVLAWLERHNRKIINGSRALRLEVSKVNQYMALNQAGIETPKTLAAVGKDNILRSAEKLGSKHFITKHNRAGKGQGVILYDSVATLELALSRPDYDPPIDGIMLIQEYIQSPTPHIIRHEFIGGKFMYAVKVDTSDGFELCPADACSIEDIMCPTSKSPQTTVKFEILKNYRPSFIEKYEKFLLTNNVQVAGIEAIEDANGKTYTYDVNTNTNYNSDAESIAGQYGMLNLATYLSACLNGI